MQITIIGAGSMAKGIGTRLSTTSHSLTIYNRKIEEAQELASKFGNNAVAKSLDESIEGDVVILALPYSALSEVIAAHKDELAGKIIVDISNPVNFETFQLIPPAGASGAEIIAQSLPEGAKLVKAFNTTFAGTLEQGQVDGKSLDVFIAGDDSSAKDALKQIVTEAGLRPIDAGPLAHARHLEGFMLIHMTAQEQLGTNWMSAIKILP